ncbi:hypothetical protein [Jiangella mangrovi]|uniref:Putative small secreted protein n=1 Tax=Jiangella mangrovi TaxID=1524084 RepID=A0A7W9GX12_9ACTN|nr:hypothetical protein [Jiangella mangrovi]MBB5791584.1 putative small secreted protein [Jiangella mangrovi]
MRRHRTIAALVAALAMVLGGCAGAASIGAGADRTTAPEDDRFGAMVVSERGNLIKDIGVLAAIVDERNGVSRVEFTVDAIEVDPGCATDAGPALNGHFVVVTITVSTAATMSENDGPAEISFDPSMWWIIGPDGAAEESSSSEAAFSCLGEAELLPVGLGPGENHTGKIVLDTAHATGTILYAPFVEPGGWEWQY